MWFSLQLRVNSFLTLKKYITKSFLNLKIFIAFACNAKNFVIVIIFFFFALACNAKGFATVFLFLRLRVAQKALQFVILFFSSFFSTVFFDGLAKFTAFACNTKSFAFVFLFFLLFLFLVSAFGQTAKNFLRYFFSFLIQKVCDQDRNFFSGLIKKRFRKNYSLTCYLRRVLHMTCHVSYRKIMMAEVSGNIQ